jgi:hypothetical protein
VATGKSGQAGVSEPHHEVSELVAKLCLVGGEVRSATVNWSFIRAGTVVDRPDEVAAA